MSTARGPSKSRMSAPERREQLLDVTKEIVGEGGFHGLSIEAVARRAGITRPVVYEHFGDLAGLLDAMVEREGERALAQLEAVLPGRSAGAGAREELIAALRGYLEAVSADPVTWRLVLMPPEGAPTVLRERITAGRDAVVAALAAVVRPGLGADTGSPDPELTARTLSAVADEAARLLLTDPATYPIERLTAHADWLLARLRLAGADVGPATSVARVIWAVIGIVVVAALVAFVWLTYNRMVARRLATENRWSQIDVALRRRHDLIPALVEAVKGYASHERTTFENVTEARSSAIAAEGPASRAAAEGELGRGTASAARRRRGLPRARGIEQLLQAPDRPSRGRGPDRDHPPRLQRHGRDLQHPDPDLPRGDRRPPVRLRPARVLRRPGGGRGAPQVSLSPGPA